MSVRLDPPPGRNSPDDAPKVPWRALAFVAIAAVSLMFWQLSATGGGREPIAYSAFHNMVTDAKVEWVILAGDQVSGAFKQPETVDGRRMKEFVTVLPRDATRELLPALRAQGVTVRAESEQRPALVQLLYMLLPWVLIIGVWVWLSRRTARNMMGASGGLNPFARGKSHRVHKEDSVQVKFSDVAGLTGPKRDLLEVVDFLREPEPFGRLGGKVPRGLLLVGPPGTGKTLLARAVAGEAEVPFFSMNGSEFIELFVGMGASRVRELFEEARQVAPSIIFIDEIDAVGRARGAGFGGGHDEREQTLNQLLSEMDGFARNDRVIIMAGTNRPDVLDPALLRPGRFDRRVTIDRPECAARVAILEVHTRDKPLDEDVSLKEIALATPGFSGADLANLANEAALQAVRRRADRIEQRDFSAAMDKILLGDPRDTVLTAAEKRRIALHESGHAVVAHFSPEVDPLRRVTILPRGMSLGHTQQANLSDRHIYSQPELHARLRTLLGGYAAEHLVMGNVSSGSEDDLRKATDLALSMVAHFGMSQQLGPVYYEHRVEHAFLGQRLATESGVSDRTVHILEQQARSLLATAREEAERLIAQHRDALERLVAALMEHETLEGERLEEVLRRPQAEEAAE
jgi:cell division protease FtsH